MGEISHDQELISYGSKCSGSWESRAIINTVLKEKLEKAQVADICLSWYAIYFTIEQKDG